MKEKERNEKKGKEMKGDDALRSAVDASRTETLS